MNNKHSFINALVNYKDANKLPIIAEIKVSTPQCPDLLRQRSIASIAQQYEQANVACISVVTGKWFGGSTDLLEQVAAATSLPILRKDFIVSRSAIERSKQLGASAVLLTKKLVDSKVLTRLVDYALSQGLTPFVEVDSAAEIAEVRLDEEAVLAICNRDIRTKETDDGDISKSLTLLQQAGVTGAGAVVSASAITGADDAQQLINAGFNGLLIGTALLKAPDLDKCLQQYSQVFKQEPVNIA